MNLLVDPVIYAIPSVNGNTDAHIQFIDSLSHWSEEIRAKRHNFFVWYDCMNALSQANCFPNLGNLRQLWQQLHEEEVSVDLAFQACLRLLDPPYLDEWLEDPSLDDLLVDEASFSVRPDLLQRLPPIVAAAFQQTLGKIAYIKEMKDESPVSDLHLVTHPVTGEPIATIAAQVVAYEGSIEVNSDLPLVTNPDELDALQDLADQWQDAVAAIAWLAREMKRNGELPPKAQLAPFAIGPEFIDSIARYHFDKNLGWLNKIYRQCVFLLTGNIPYNTKEHHHLGGEKQERHDSWGACRLQITKSPSAIRLHYWHDGRRSILMDVSCSSKHKDEDYKISKPPHDAFK